jgi:CDP-diacylglycerol--glycerol-3-phosphate 3-phosphatidyltransferase
MIDGRRDRTREPQGTSAAAQRGGIGARLVRLGVSADLVTALGVVIAAVNAVVIGTGHLYVACALLIVGGLMDTLDGAVAKAAGSSSARGAFLDSVADRVADSLLFGGLAWYLAVGRHPADALLPVAILAVSSVISYERAKAESLGFSARGGLMERAERLIGFGLAMLVHVVMIPLLVALLVLTTGTAIGRFVRVWRQASGTVVAASPATVRLWRRGKVESRWRQLRETGSPVPGRLSGAPSARWRNRRREAPLSTRLRRVLSTQDAARASRPKAPRAERSARALRRRMDDGRSR